MTIILVALVALCLIQGGSLLVAFAYILVLRRRNTWLRRQLIRNEDARVVPIWPTNRRPPGGLRVIRPVSPPSPPSPTNRHP